MSTHRDLIKNSFVDWYLGCQKSLVEEYLSVKDGTLEAVRDHFAASDVAVKSRGGIMKFKYEDGCKFDKPFQLAARGTTFIGDHRMFSINKFFNAHSIGRDLKFHSENRDGLTVPVEFLDTLKQQGFTFSWRPKWDGSYVQSFSDGTTIHSYTMGSVNPENKMQVATGTTPTFSELVNELMDPSMTAKLHAHPYHSVVHELCSHHNRIITQYALGDGVRGKLLPIVDIAPDGIPRDSFFPQPPTRWNFEIQDYAPSLQKVFDALLASPEVYGSDPEGACLYAESSTGEVFPIAKAKRPEYCALHSEGISAIGDSRDLCRVQRKYCAGKADNLQENIHIAHAAAFADYIASMARKLVRYVPILQACCSNPKKYTLFVNAMSLPEWLKDTLAIACRPRHLIGSDLEAKCGKYIIDVLKSVNRNGDTCLSNRQAAKGATWFVSSIVEAAPVSIEPRPLEVPGIVIAETSAIFEKMLAKTADGRYAPPARYDVLDMLRGYNKGGYQIVICADSHFHDLMLATSRTGVDDPAPHAHKVYHVPSEAPECVVRMSLNKIFQDEGINDIRIYVDILDVKQVLRDVMAANPNTRHVIHLGTQPDVMLECCDITDGKLRYVPALCASRGVSPLPPRPKSLVITMVQGPGSGKTKTLLKLHSMLFGRSYKPTIVSEVECQGSFEIMKGKVDALVSKGHTVLIDACNDNPDMLKHIKALDKQGLAEVCIVSFMQTSVHKRKKHILVRNEEYQAFTNSNCIRDIDPEEVGLISDTTRNACRRSDACFQQALSKDRNVVMMASSESILTINEMMGLMWKAIDSKRLLTMSRNEYYLGVPIHPANLPASTLPNGVSLSLCGLVIVPPKGDRDDTYLRPGSHCSLIIGSSVSNDGVEACKVQINGRRGPNHPHVVISVAKGVPSVAGILLMKDNQHDLASEIEGIPYESHVVPM